MSETVKNTETQSKPKKGKKVLNSILNTIINILIVVVLVVSLLVAVMALSSKSNGIATIFGYTFHTIQTASMDGGNPAYEGGDYKVGDLVIGKAVGASDYDYAVGDIVAYRTDSVIDGEIALVCHRIIDVYDNNGILTYQTQGDANDTPDQDTPDKYIHNYDIASLCYDSNYHGKVLKGWGAPLDYLRTQQGFFFTVLLPMIIFFLYALVRVVLSATSYKKTKTEEEKKEAVEAAVAAALAMKNADNPDEISVPEGMSPEQVEQFKQFIEFQKMQNASQEPTPAEEATETPENNE